MAKYSKLRYVLAVVVLFWGLSIVGLGFSMTGWNQQMMPYVTRGLNARIVILEKDYVQQGLNESASKEEFEKGLTELKTVLGRVEKGEVFGAWGMFLEKLSLFLCFLAGILFLLNVYFLLRRHMFLDICMKLSMAAALAFFISYGYWCFIQWSFTLQVVEDAIGLQLMLKNTQVHAIEAGSILRSTFSSRSVMYGLGLIFSLYCGLPFSLYMLIKMREKPVASE
jgi:hypothetical protein